MSNYIAKGIITDMVEYTFDDLYYIGPSHRSHTQAKGGKKETKYLTFIRCKIGEFPESEWIRLMKELIDQSDETEIYGQLVVWEKENCAWIHTVSQAEMAALIDHSFRLFENERWVDFVPFNDRFCPERLKTAHLVKVRNHCCSKEGIITAAQIQASVNGTVRCPFCGRWSEYDLMLDLTEKTA